jgi:glycosyltransferase involved in cell wall biosynthesis
VGFLYHSSAPKGVDLVLKVITKINTQFPNLRIISFGTEQPVKGLFLPKGTEFLFNPPQSDLRKLYSQCDVWLSASRTEGFNLPALEAMACRTPVVSTSTGWPEEAIKTGWNGVLVPIEDVAGLTQGVEFVLSRADPDWRALSTNAYATAATSSWQRSAFMFEHALQHACLRARRNEFMKE